MAIAFGTGEVQGEFVSEDVCLRVGTAQGGQLILFFFFFFFFSGDVHSFKLLIHNYPLLGIIAKFEIQSFWLETIKQLLDFE